MTPDEFWNSTIDEISLMVRAQVDRMRLMRLNAFKIVEGYRGTKDMPPITEFYSLPFDDEIQKQEKDEIERVQRESEEIYMLAREAGYFNTPISKN